MRFDIRDFVVSGGVGILCFASAIASGWFLNSFWAFLGALSFSALLVAAILQRIAPLVSGEFFLHERSSLAMRWRLQGFLALWHFGLLIHTGLLPVTIRFLIYRILGTPIGSAVMLGGKIIDPLMVQIGNDVILGEDSLVLGHMIANQKVILETVRIEDGATVGAKAIIFPGVTIGPKAVIAAGAVVLRGTVIGASEVWAGVPAKMISSG